MPELISVIDRTDSGIVSIPAGKLEGWIGALKNENAQAEYYLTDIIEMAVSDGVPVEGIEASELEVTGINDRAQLAQVERIYQKTQAAALMRAGATLADPERIDIRGTVSCGQDCFIDINVVLEGEVTLGRGVRVRH